MLNRTEAPIFYSQKTEPWDLPPFLKIDSVGKLLFTPGNVDEEHMRPYDFILDFGRSRKSLQGAVPEDLRIVANDQPGVRFIGFDSPEVMADMQRLKDIANDPTKSPDNPEDRREYRAVLGNVYKYLAAAVREKIGDETALFFPPKNGGKYVEDIFREAGYQDFYDYRMARIHPINDPDGLMVGVNLGNNDYDLSKIKTFVFADDCLASDVSAWGTLEMLKQSLQEKGVDLKEIKIVIAVSAASQKGVESLLAAKEHFGFGSLDIIAAVPVYRLDDHYYLVDDEGNFVVGDIGKWSRDPDEKPGLA